MQRTNFLARLTDLIATVATCDLPADDRRAPIIWTRCTNTF